MNKKILILFFVIIVISIFVYFSNYIRYIYDPWSGDPVCSLGCGVTENDLCKFRGPPFICPAVYMYEYSCKKFASCEVENNECITIKDPRFDECLECFSTAYRDDGEGIEMCREIYNS